MIYIDVFFFCECYYKLSWEEFGYIGYIKLKLI